MRGRIHQKLSAFAVGRKTGHATVLSLRSLRNVNNKFGRTREYNNGNAGVFPSTINTTISAPKKLIIESSRIPKRYQIQFPSLFHRTTSTESSQNLVGDLSSSERDNIVLDKPVVRVSEDGSRIVVRFVADADGSMVESTYHSPWLWLNDPDGIHPTSGQKTRSMIAYYSGKWKIQSASVVDSIRITTMTTKSLPPPPPIGSLHSIGGIYDDKEGNHENDDVCSGNASSHCKNSDQVTLPHPQCLLHVKWQFSSNNEENKVDGLEQSSAIVESFFDMNWLWQCRYDSEALSKRLQHTRISQENSITSKTALKRREFIDLMNQRTSDNIRFALLDAIIEDGAAIVENTPATFSDDGESRNNDGDSGIEKLSPMPSVAYVGKSLAGGSLSHGNLYGDLFHVQTKVGANNIAYTSDALVPHQDLAYYESPPGLQLLQCVNNHGVTGGQSVLIDCIAAAEYFRTVCPHLFRMLVQYEATFLKQRRGADLVYRRPHIILAGDDLENSPVTSVRWSPPFEGPLAIPGGILDDYCLAYSAFSRMIDSSFSPNERILQCIPWALEERLANYAHENTWEYMLQPGEVLIFNNQRMLHGRRSFTVAENHSNTSDSGRHLIGCYTNIDDTLNEYRLLRRLRLRTANHLDVSYIRNMGNGSSGAT